MVRLATVLLIIGGLNWGLIGLFQFDLVAAIFGGQAGFFSRVIYTIVGAAAVYTTYLYPRFKRIENKPSSVEQFKRAA
jgi:uncharacterized protein